MAATTIAQEISRLTAAKADLKTAIEGKGVTVPSSTLLDGYADLVDQIQQGGAEEAPENDVNFYDYDGRRIASYTITEAKALTSLPTPPSHEGLTFQEWNWTLSELQNYNRRYANVGANYVTTDGKTHLFVKAQASEEVAIGFTIKDGTLTVDWGDGSSNNSQSGSASGTNRVFTHTYQQSGNYDIVLTYSGNENFGPFNMNNTAFWNVPVFEIRCGNDCSLSYSSALASMTGIVSISKSTECNANSLVRGSSIPSLSIPNGSTITNSGSYAYYDGVVCLPASTSDIAGLNFIYGNSHIIVVPNSMGTTTVAYSALQQCNRTHAISIPLEFEFDTRASGDFLNGCIVLEYIDIAQGWIPTQSMNLGYSTMWSADSMVDFFTKLGTTQTAITLTFGTANLNKLTADQKAIATGKGYTLA